MRLEGLVSNLRSVRPQTSQDLLILWEYIYMYIIYIQTYIYICIYIYTPRNSFGKQIAGGKILLKLRRKLEKTAGILPKRPRIQTLPDLRCITLELWAIMPAGNMTIQKKTTANQNCRRRFKHAGKHQKVPFTRQSRLFPERQK